MEINKFLVKLERNATDNYKMLWQVYGEITMSRKHACWVM